MKCTVLEPVLGPLFVITVGSANSQTKNLNHLSIKLWYGTAHGVLVGHLIQEFMELSLFPSVLITKLVYIKEFNILLFKWLNQ